ncbi:MAG: hypothetical protein KA144_11415 [Xanthomonadaceae bacterium]|nr:hypothetical protein [Xanthomonadaceae bacterium]
MNARVEKTCAPWDGAAFVLSVRLGRSDDPMALPGLRLSVWRSPLFDRAQTVAFVEDAAEIGVVSHIDEAERSTTLEGEARFIPVANGAIEGTLNLKSTDGRRFERRFRAPPTGTPLCG